ncbi:MAG: 4Fe-4S binding protein [Clostridiales bacterium]|nr:4Fe-4S binding protein [Clostridiales bacterium]
MAKIIIDPDRCKGCGLCATACPKKLLCFDDKELNAKGFHPASIPEAEKCVGCGLCVTMCPDMAIRLER